MKLLINALAACCLFAVIGCSSTGSNDASMSAVSECKPGCDIACCEKAKAAPGAVSDKAQCPSTCPMQKSGDANMGAVSDKPQCPLTGGCSKKSSDASMGAVSDTKPSCCPSKCSGAK